MKHLDFEKPIEELNEKIEQLKTISTDSNMEFSDEIKSIEKRAKKVKKEIYDNLTTGQILQISRHPDRPDSLSLFRFIFDDFLECHGDRAFRDDPSIVGGIARLKNHRVVLIGHQKGHDTKENIFRNFGMPHPEGYRKALRLMKMAHTFNMPIITLIDTPGAYPGIEAEERGQAEAIARNLKEMINLEVPIISIVIGEGGSGGAIGIGVANKLFMMEFAIYSVISPEGCSSILFRDASKAGKAAEKLKITSKDIIELKVADGVIKEPLGGAHHNWKLTADNMRKCILKELDDYKENFSKQEILDERYHKFRQMGQFVEVQDDTSQPQSDTHSES